MKVLKRALLLIWATMALSSLSFATILCDVPTAISVIIAAGGCAFGPNTFTNVSISTSTESPGTPAGSIDSTQVALQVTTTGPVPDYLNLIVSNLTPSNWGLTGTQQFNLILTYTLAGGPFSGMGDSFNGSGTTSVSPIGTGAISFDKNECSSCPGGVSLPTLSLAFMSQGATSFAQTNGPLNITDNIQVHATNASATLLNATNSFVIPEPMTFEGRQNDSGRIVPWSTSPPGDKPDQGWKRGQDRRVGGFRLGPTPRAFLTRRPMDRGGGTHRWWFQPDLPRAFSR